MKKPQFPWILAGILIVSLLAFHLVGLILAGLGCGVAYLAATPSENETWPLQGVW